MSTVYKCHINIHQSNDNPSIDCRNCCWTWKAVHLSTFVPIRQSDSGPVIYPTPTFGCYTPVRRPLDATCASDGFSCIRGDSSITRLPQCCATVRLHTAPGTHHTCRGSGVDVDTQVRVKILLVDGVVPHVSGKGLQALVWPRSATLGARCYALLKTHHPPNMPRIAAEKPPPSPPSPSPPLPPSPPPPPAASISGSIASKLSTMRPNVGRSPGLWWKHDTTTAANPGNLPAHATAGRRLPSATCDGGREDAGAQ